MKQTFSKLFLLLLIFSCTGKPVPPTINPEAFNKTIDGKQVKLFTLKNQKGMEITVTNWGARIVSCLVPDKKGVMADVVFGHDSIDGYLNAKENYFGAAIGRYGNRIAKGEFLLGDIQYKLAQNNGVNSLHGGVNGFSKKIWDVVQKGSGELNLKLVSPDMDEGYPGELQVSMIYRLTNDNELVIQYEAKCDKATVINLTNHSYFNLHGAGNGTILDHLLTLNADFFTPIDSTLIPTGEFRPVDNTPFDFRNPTLIGARINSDDQQIRFGLGYDMNFVLKKSPDQNVSLAASVYEPESGRLLEVFTDQPGIQFYSGNFLDGIYPGKKGKSYGHRTGFCLETQHFPNSPNQPKFPSVVLSPDQVYTHTCIYKFSVK
ncbi:MAG TPA: aldose epimerase family protein [Prolixibacteraceae bacterium]|nr:aldose epimerase family protein [Prolixibacteraceae bacterium]